MKIEINPQSLIEHGIPIYGDLTIEGKTPSEKSECQTIVNETRRIYPEAMFLHIKNEGKRTKQQMQFEASMGFLKGASDYIFIGNPMLCLEIKQANYKNSSIDTMQIQFLKKAKKSGCMVGVAFGWQGAMEAIKLWNKAQKKPHS
jgi:hypothetical protein